MSAVIPFLPLLAAISGKAQKLMDIILHIGAQRTASTTLQSYLRANAARLRDQGIGFWGPLRTRHGGVLSGVLPVPGQPPRPGFDQARARIARQCEAAEQRGLKALIVSDENMLGTVRANLREAALYPDAAERLGLYAQAFGGTVRRIALGVRGLDAYWSSALAYAVGRGHALPDAALLDALARARRSWQHVVEDAASAFPGAEIQVHLHETHAGRPERRLWHMVAGGVEPPLKHARLWLHRAPTLDELRAILAERGADPAALPRGVGRWWPFGAEHTAALRETHADDMFWLQAGAGGLATLIEEDRPDQAGHNLPGGRARTRGPKDDGKEGRMARTG